MPPNLRLLVIASCTELQKFPDLSKYEDLSLICIKDAGDQIDLQQLEKDYPGIKFAIIPSSTHSADLKQDKIALDASTYTDPETTFRPSYSIFSGPDGKPIPPPEYRHTILTNIASDEKNKLVIQVPTHAWIPLEEIDDKQEITPTDLKIMTENDFLVEWRFHLSWVMNSLFQHLTFPAKLKKYHRVVKYFMMQT